MELHREASNKEELQQVRVQVPLLAIIRVYLLFLSIETKSERGFSKVIYEEKAIVSEASHDSTAVQVLLLVLVPRQIMRPSYVSTSTCTSSK